jgi:hypothetical protein
MRRHHLLSAFVAGALVAGTTVAVFAPPASAGGAPTLFVTTADDELDADPGANLADLSLREAFELAADDGEASTIVLEDDTTYELDVCGAADAQEDLNADGDLDHAPPTSQALTIFGHGATIRQTCPGERVLQHRPSAAMELLEVTITGGDADGPGGGIRVDGSGGRLIVGDVEVVGNLARGTGGGIDNSGIQTVLVDSTLADNRSGEVGGGVHSPASTALQVLRSTISHNTAELTAGGLYAYAPQIIDSTIVANRVLPVKGSAFGANLFAEGGATLRGTVVALGAGGDDCATLGMHQSEGGNLTSDSSCGIGGGDVYAQHPELGPLADNGGPTRTHRAAVGSPAFDIIPFLDCFSATDQRGEPRPQPDEGSCDGGSVEAPAAPCTPPAFSDVGVGHPFFADVCWLDQMAVTTGFPDGTFKPSAPVTRQSMAALLYRFALAPPFPAPSTPSFTDVGVGHPFFAEVEWLVGEGIAEGFSDQTYRPSSPVSRQAMAAFMLRSLGEHRYTAPAASRFSDVSPSHAFFAEIHWTADFRVSEGYADGTWRPAAPVTRQAMSAFLHRLASVPRSLD